MPAISLQLLPGEFSVCRLLPVAPIPAWAHSTSFCSITRTADELSLLCPTGQIPAGVRAEHGWRLLKFAGPFAFESVGVLASVTTPLAAAGISLLAVATFETDYVLVKADRMAAALQALRAAGHGIVGN